MHKTKSNACSRIRILKFAARFCMLYVSRAARFDALNLANAKSYDHKRIRASFDYAASGLISEPALNRRPVSHMAPPNGRRWVSSLSLSLEIYAHSRSERLWCIKCDCNHAQLAGFNQLAACTHRQGSRVSEVVELWHRRICSPLKSDA